MKVERPTVFVSQRLPQRWRAECTIRDLQPQKIDDDFASLSAACKSQARAIVAMARQPLASPRDRRHLLNAIELSRAALDRGILPIIAVEGDNNDWAYATGEIDKSYPNRQIGVDERFRPLAVHLSNVKAGRVAQRILEHQPGRVETDVSINLVNGSKIHEDDEILLKRAFNDYNSIDVETIRQRRDSYIYRVRVRTEDSEGPIFYVVKSLPFAALDQEIGIIRNILPESTPFANIPPLVHDRCVSTAGRSAMVGHFVDRASVLSKFIQSHSPSLAITSIFDGPLRCWRSSTRIENANIVEYAIPRIAPRAPQKYLKAYQRAKSIYGPLRTPVQLIGALKSTGVMAVQMCFSHGDLHLDNIFVRDGSSDVVLIDFNRSGDAPASRDPAELDAALAFAVGGSRSESALPPDLLRACFQRPILAPRVSCRTENPRALAIEQVRRQTVGTCSEDEYRLMLACHCLWWAKQGNPHAYLAAELLV